MRNVLPNRARRSISTFLTRPGSMPSVRSLQYLPSVRSTGPTNLPEAIPPVPPLTIHPTKKSFMGWRKKRNAQDPNFSRKLVLRIVALAFTLGSIIAALIIPSDGFVTVYTTFFVPAWIDSLAWNVVWIIIMINRSRPICPGAVIGIDLIDSLGYLVPAAIGWRYFTGFDDWTIAWNGGGGHSYDANNASGVASNAGNVTSQNMYTAANATHGGMSMHHNLLMMRGDHHGDHDQGGQNSYDTSYLLINFGVASVFATLALATHFWLFILGCIDENRRRKDSEKARQMPRIVVVCADCNKKDCAHCPPGADRQDDLEKETIDFLTYYSPSRDMRDGRIV